MVWKILLAALIAAAPPAEPSQEAGPVPAKKSSGARKKANANKDADADEARGDDSRPKARRVLDRTYVPSVGDRAILHVEDEKGESFSTWAVRTPEAFRDYALAEMKGDEGAMERLEKQGSAVLFDEDEPAVVVQGLDQIAIQVGVVQGRAFGVGQAVATVRLLEGAHKNEVLLVPAHHLAHFVEVADIPSTRRAPSRKKAPKRDSAKADATPGKAATAATRAASLLRMGQDLEKSGKTAGALEFYRKLITQYPDAPQARAAADRIEVIEKE